MKRFARKFGWLIAAVAVLAFGAVLLFNKQKDNRPLVGITQIAAHPSLDEVREGIVEGLADRGYKDKANVRIEFRNANGDPSLALPIAQEFVRQKAAVIVPITTPSAIAVAKATENIPIVFAGVTDPVGVGLVKSLKNGSGNITGTSDRWPFREQLTFFKELMPGLKVLGMLYKPGDDVSKLAVTAMADGAPSVGIKLQIRPVSLPADLYPVSVQMLSEVDAVFVGLDSLVAENLEVLLKAAAEAGKPVFAGDSGSVKRGAVAAVSVSMKEVGKIAGGMAADVLDGKAPGQIPVWSVTSGEKLVNKSALNDARFDHARLARPDVKLQ